MPKLTFSLNETGHGKVMLDGMDISHCTTALSYQASSGSKLAEINLKIVAEVDAEVEARLDKLTIEKSGFIYPDSTGIVEGHVMHGLPKASQ